MIEKETIKKKKYEKLNEEDFFSKKNEINRIGSSIIPVLIENRDQLEIARKWERWSGGRGL